MRSAEIDNQLLLILTRKKNLSHTLIYSLNELIQVSFIHFHLKKFCTFYSSKLHTFLTCGNQRLTIKHYKQDCPQWRDNRKIYNIQGDTGTLLGKNCKVEKMMRFLKETKIFKEI